MPHQSHIFVIIVVLFCVIAQVIATPENTTKQEVLVENAQLPSLLDRHKRVVVCYISLTPETNEQDVMKFNIRQDLDCQLCTHVIFTGFTINALLGKINSNSLYKIDFMKVKTRKNCAHLKLSFSLKESENSLAFSKISASPELKKSFIQSVIGFLMDFGFDGIDLDLDMDVPMGYDKNLLTSMIEELRKEIQDTQKIQNSAMTAALSKSRETIQDVYNIPKLFGILDFLHIKTFNYHGPWENFTGPSAPLKASNAGDILNVAATLQYYIANGANVQNMVLGVPFFGYEFKLKEYDTAKGFGAEVEKPINDKKYRRFNQICRDLESEGSPWSMYKDSVSKTPYAQNNNLWLTYENIWSIEEKARFAVTSGLAGVMIWTVDMDHFNINGNCNKSTSSGKFRMPLLGSVNEGMIKATDNGLEFTEIIDGSDETSWLVVMGIAAVVIVCILVAVILISRYWYASE